MEPLTVLAVLCDVTDQAAVDHAIPAIVEQLGGIDILVNNVGIGANGDVSQNDETEWARVLDVNVTGIARVTRATLPHLQRTQRRRSRTDVGHDADNATAEHRHHRRAASPSLGRMVTAEEVAYAVTSLASPAAASTNGTILRVDGGMTTLRL